MQDDDLYERLRAEAFAQAVEIQDESQLEDLLDRIAAYAADDLGAVSFDREEISEWEAEELLATVEAWASLASHVTLEAYAGPIREVGAMRLRVGGFAKGVCARLTRLVQLFRSHLTKAMEALSAASFSISVNFPAGISVGLSWT